jgi:N-acetylneuraminate synthase
MASLTIGARRLGPDSPPLLIAELSGNHNGRLDHALAIVAAAAHAGADAIKLQTFTPATLTVDSDRPEFFIDDPGGPWHRRRLWELYEEAHTPWEWHEPLFRAAREAGLLCFSSAFDESSVSFLAGIGVDAIKIASFELVHLPLIAAAARTRLPLILSTGMATLSEIEEAVAVLRSAEHDRFILLKCTSAYPADGRDADLLAMGDLQARFKCLVGLSDHTLPPYTAYAAAALGAAVIEKHLTLSRDHGGVDASFSLEPAELRGLSDGIAAIWETRGQVRYGVKPLEQASLRERPSIYVVQKVRKGDVFGPANLRVIRPGAGLPPKHWHDVMGKIAARDIDTAVPLSWDLIENSTG